MEIQSFCFSPFSENTYVLYDATKECVIVDPGCYDQKEQETLVQFIEDQGLQPVLLLNTHCHIDHVFGNAFVSEKYGLSLHAHALEEEVLRFAAGSAHLYGLDYTPSPEISVHLVEGQKVTFGKTELDIVFTPGHSPGSVSFLHQATQTALVGDVLFLDSIGRTDLPGGDFDTLINSIKTELLSLDDAWKVYNGHGPYTTIGRERRYNPFLRTT